MSKLKTSRKTQMKTTTTTTTDSPVNCLVRINLVPEWHIQKSWTWTHTSRLPGFCVSSPRSRHCRYTSYLSPRCLPFLASGTQHPTGQLLNKLAGGSALWRIYFCPRFHSFSRECKRQYSVSLIYISYQADILSGSIFQHISIIHPNVWPEICPTWYLWRM